MPSLAGVEDGAPDAEEFRLSARGGESSDVAEAVARARGLGRDVLDVLLSSTDDLSGNTSLHYAAANGHVDIVEALLSAGAKLDVTNFAGSTPLHYCAASAAVDCARFLLAKGADALALNAAQATPLDDALRMAGPETEISKMLLEAAEKQTDVADDLAGDEDPNGDCEETATSEGKDNDP